LPDAHTITVRRKPTYWIPALTALAGAGILIYWTSTARPLWVDEEMVLLNVRDRGFARLAGALWLDQSAPLGWLALERLALLTLGTDERGVRLLTVLFGIGTLFTGVWIGRRWMSPAGATVLVLLCALGEWIVFFTLELKHYSSDTFWALFLPALAVWALEDSSSPKSPTTVASGLSRKPQHAETINAETAKTAEKSSGMLPRRIAVWWMVAAIGQWFGNGALFVTPACAIVLCVERWRRAGLRPASWTALAGAPWLVSFALNYALVLRHALANTYLKNYWAFAFPQPSEGAGATVASLVSQFGEFPLKPGGSSLSAVFWLAVAIGIVFALATRRPLGLMVAAVPISAVALAVFHVVPMFERLALWTVPAIYLAIGLCADAALWFAGRARPLGRAAGLLLGLVTGATAGLVAVNIAQRGAGALEARPRSNYGLDDRSSVRWLLAAHRPGDVILTTHYGLAALWWYGGLDISNADDGGRLPDGSQIFEIGHVPPGRGCSGSSDQLSNVISGHDRVVVYLGFRLNVEPVGFDNLVLQELGRRAGLVSYKKFAEESHLALFDVTRTPTETLILPTSRGTGIGQAPPTAAGCIAVRPARRW
jgi:hypothetical protein